MGRIVARIEDLVAGLALAVFSVAILTGVVFRYLLAMPLSWPEEVSLIAFSWLLFFGAAICARENAHIIIALIAPRPGGLADRTTEAFAAAVAAVVALLMAWIAYRYTVGAASMMTPIFRLSSAVYNAAAPVGFALIAIHMAVNAVRAFTGGGTDIRPDEGV